MSNTSRVGDAVVGDEQVGNSDDDATTTGPTVETFVLFSADMSGGMRPQMTGNING